MRDGVGLVARLVTGSVWVVAGALKLPDVAASVRAVRAYDLLPEAVVPLVGTLLPVLEVVLGACLLVGLLTRTSSVLSSLLLVAFMVAIASAWARGLQVECGCFGGGGPLDDAGPAYVTALARDAGLLLLSAWLVARPRTLWSLDRVISRTTTQTEGKDVEEADGEEEER